MSCSFTNNQGGVKILDKKDDLEEFVNGLVETEDDGLEEIEEEPENIGGTDNRGSLSGYSIALMVDTSYSMMSGNKMRDAKDALNKFLENIDLSQNFIELIDFGDGVSRHGYTQNRMELRNQIENLKPSGVTPMRGALLIAYEYVLKDKKNATIILATDGQPTDFPKDQILRYAETIKNDDVWIITVGIGSDVDQDFLEELAVKPEYYYFAELSSDLVRVYEEIEKELELLPSR